MDTFKALFHRRRLAKWTRIPTETDEDCQSTRLIAKAPSAPEFTAQMAQKENVILSQPKQKTKSSPAGSSPKLIDDQVPLINL